VIFIVNELKENSIYVCDSAQITDDLDIEEYCKYGGI
jgi:hypothetical protein